VFVAAVTLRHRRPEHHYHRIMHQFIGETEQLVSVALLVLFGAALVTGLLSDLTMRAVIAAALPSSSCDRSPDGWRCGEAARRVTSAGRSASSAFAESARSTTSQSRCRQAGSLPSTSCGQLSPSLCCFRSSCTESPRHRSWSCSIVGEPVERGCSPGVRHRIAIGGPGSGGGPNGPGSGFGIGVVGSGSGIGDGIGTGTWPSGGVVGPAVFDGVMARSLLGGR
jgi:hypothetical protein